MCVRTLLVPVEQTDGCSCTAYVLKYFAMNELIQIAFSPLNIVYTFLLVLVVLYWLLIIIGAMDIGSVDIDFDLEVDVDLDVDVDTGLNTSGAGGLAGVLHFFNFGKIPFIIILSFVILFSWAGSILANYYIGNGSILFGLALMVPNLFVGLCLTKMITTPLLPVFEKMEAGIEPVDYVGMLCKLVLPATTSKMGQAEVIIDNNRLLINVKMENESTDSLEKGAEAIILRKQKDKPYYIIQRYNESEVF